MAPVISVDGLSKKYLISHKQRPRYGTFRDALAETAGNFARRALHSFRSSSDKPGGRPLSMEEFWALKDVSFQMSAGERLGIIGRNGAGKTTLLKILSRITEPTGGRVLLRGRVASLLEVGTGFHPELTGRENIFLNGAILGMGRREIHRKFDEIVAFAEVEKFLDTPVKRYSSGMYVRLAFAVAAHLDPEILIVDEVLAVGDAQFQKKCLGKMEDVSTQGRTVLFVSHNMPAVLGLCSRGLYLSEGRLMKDGPIDEVVHTYLSQGVNSQGDSPVESLPRQPGLGEVLRFTKCVLKNASSVVVTSLQFGEPLDISLEAIPRISLENVSFIVRVESFSGEAVASAASEETGELFSLKPGEPFRLKVHVGDLFLAPGIYWLSVAARCGLVGQDQVLRARKFEVLQSPFPGFKPHSGIWGHVNLRPRWQRVSGAEERDEPVSVPPR